MDNLEPTQKFTGYWIPAELSKLGLSKMEQFLLSIIDSLEADAPRYCFASNSFLAQQMDLSESRVSFYITKFKRMGLIEEVSFDGRRRRLRTLKENWYKLKDEFSKKELCVKTRSRGARSHEVCMRESTNHIIKNNNKENIPPLSSPKKNQPKKEEPEKIKPSKEDISLRSDEEEIIFGILENTALSPKERKRLSREYTEDQVIKAMEIAKTQTIKKSLMGLLLSILQNPENWETKEKTKQLSWNQQIALNYNKKLSKLRPDLAEENEKLIETGNGCVKVILTGGIIEQLSLIALDFNKDMEKAQKLLDEYIKQNKKK